MKQIINLFLPNLTSLRSVFNEVSNTSISREKFIDFTKIIGLFSDLKKLNSANLRFFFQISEQ